MAQRAQNGQTWPRMAQNVLNVIISNMVTARIIIPLRFNFLPIIFNESLLYSVKMVNFRRDRFDEADVIGNLWCVLRCFLQLMISITLNRILICLNSKKLLFFKFLKSLLRFLKLSFGVLRFLFLFLQLCTFFFVFANFFFSFVPFFLSFDPFSLDFFLIPEKVLFLINLAPSC